MAGGRWEDALALLFSGIKITQCQSITVQMVHSQESRGGPSEDVCNGQMLLGTSAPRWCLPLCPWKPRSWFD